MLEEKRVEVAGGRLSYAVGPETGPPLVFLHGVTRCWQDFLPLIPSLMVRWQVFGLDFRGHGASDRAAGRYLVPDYVEDAVGFLRSELSEPAVLYGHSLGAMVACGAAAAAPDRVRAVVLEDPPFHTLGREIRNTQFLSYFEGLRELLRREPDSAETLAHWMAETRISKPGSPVSVRLGDTRDAAQLRFGARCLLRLDPAVLDPIVEGRWLDGFDLEATLDAVSCPALLLAGESSKGGMMNRDGIDLVARRIGSCAKVEVAGAGHLIHWTHTEETLRVVTAFMESLR